MNFKGEEEEEYYCYYLSVDELPKDASIEGFEYYQTKEDEEDEELSGSTSVLTDDEKYWIKKDWSKSDEFKFESIRYKNKHYKERKTSSYIGT